MDTFLSHFRLHRVCYKISHFRSDFYGMYILLQLSLTQWNTHKNVYVRLEHGRRNY
jgi:hypothetical protein